MLLIRTPAFRNAMWCVFPWFRKELSEAVIAARAGPGLDTKEKLIVPAAKTRSPKTDKDFKQMQGVSKSSQRFGQTCDPMSNRLFETERHMIYNERNHCKMKRHLLFF